MQVECHEKMLTDLNENKEASLRIVEILRANGYDYNFQLQGSKLMCMEDNHEYHQIKFQVDEIYRFNGGILQSNGFSIFALSHRSKDLKGIFVAI